MSAVMLEAIWLTYICATQGHIISWLDTGTNAIHLPDEAVCRRCGSLVKCEPEWLRKGKA